MSAYIVSLGRVLISNIGSPTLRVKHSNVPSQTSPSLFSRASRIAVLVLSSDRFQMPTPETEFFILEVVAGEDTAGCLLRLRVCRRPHRFGLLVFKEAHRIAMAICEIGISLEINTRSQSRFPSVLRAVQSHIDCRLSSIKLPRRRSHAEGRGGQ